MGIVLVKAWGPEFGSGTHVKSQPWWRAFVIQVSGSVRGVLGLAGQLAL